MKTFLLALQFLTIIPVRITGPVDKTLLGKSTVWFVAVGLLQGMLLLVTDFIMGSLFHPDITAGLLLTMLIASNGAFHLDGLADTADAYAVKSCGDEEKDRCKRLRVMKEPTSGPIGVTILIMVILLKYLCLRNIANLLPFTYFSSLLAMPMISKWCMVAAMVRSTAARPDGLGTIFLQNVKPAFLGASTCVLLAPLIFVAYKWSGYGDFDLLLFYPAVLFIGYCLTRFWVRICTRRFGGMTGDTLGALSELAELIFLMVVLAWSRLSISFVTV
jgi:adenosylcobinamide-GDP ribazoletransferase